MRQQYQAFLLLLTTFVAASTLAADAKRPDPDADPAVAPITAAFTGKDDAAAEKAAATVIHRLEDDSGWAQQHLERRWIKDLVATRRYALADDLCVKAIVADPARTRHVEIFQSWRVNICLAQDKPKEALAQAKLLYNVATMAGTESALKTIYRCLERTSGGDKALLRKFRNEQIAGKNYAAGKPPVSSGMLLDIAAEGKVFEAALASTDMVDERKAMAAGNLALLADRPDVAKEAFEVSMQLHDGAPSDEMYENIARALKAMDGTVGRANHYAIYLVSEVTP